MFALHALWRSDQRLAVWVEGPWPAEEDRPAAPWHPYAGVSALVGRLLSGVGVALEWLVGTHAEHGWTELLLPSRSGTPLASPELSGSYEPDRVELTVWRVPCLLFEPAEAAQVLGELYDPRRPFLPTELPGTGVLDIPYGASVRWLTGMHDLAWRMVGRGQLLPGLVTEHGRPHARWQPAPDGAYWAEITALTGTIPPVCRAEYLPPPRRSRVGRSGRVMAEGRSGVEIVTGLLDALVDAEARAALDGHASLLPGTDPPHGAAERWLDALSGPTGLVTSADQGELAALRGELAAWHRSETGPTGRVRTCFRLIEPIGDDEERWRLEFLMQAVDEPSLLVQAAEIWTGGPALRALEQQVDRPRDQLLTDLARAVQHYPLLRRAVGSVRPAQIVLDRDLALDFLRDAAPRLAEAGFGVLLPRWWQRPARVGLALSARAADPGIVRGESLLPKESITDFSWAASIGDTHLTEAELTDLAAARRPLVKVRGHWMEVDPEQIRAAAHFLARQRAGADPLTPADVVRAALNPQLRVGGLPVTSVTADGRLGELLTGGLQLPPVPVPPGFGTRLRPYQERGVAWLALLSGLGLGAVLADDMGLGKTVQTLALLATEVPEATDAAGRAGGAGPTLVVCPMSLVGNWQREAERLVPWLRTHVHHGPGRAAGTRLRAAAEGADVVITTYGLVQRDLADLRQVAWRRVVADEAQHVKNAATRQARAVRALPAEHRIALTGTPVENRLGELHAILDFANPGLFGSGARFKELYSLPIERTGSVRATEDLRRRTRPLMLRRVKTDPTIIADLPDKQEMTVLCNLTAEQAALYRAVAADLLEGIGSLSDDESRSGRVLAALTKLKQICNHPAQFLKEPRAGARFAARSGKVAQLEETLREALAEGDRVLCFTQFTEFGRLLADYLPRRLDGEVLFLHGGTPRKAREEMVERFQRPDGPAVFLLSLKAGGTGLNLTAANQVVHLDRWWNPAVEDQATDRAFRIGQRRDVQVRKLVCVGTLEERIDHLIETKRTLADATVGAGEGWLSDLSTKALHELIDLAAEAESE